MNERTRGLYERFVRFGSDIIRLCEELLDRPACQMISLQLCRSATAVGANYREAQRSRSRNEFASKLHVSLQEADETVHWLQIIQESEFVSAAEVAPRVQEADEIIAILVASIRTAKSKM